MEVDVEMKIEEDEIPSKKGCPLPKELMFRELGLNPNINQRQRKLTVIGSKVVSDNLEVTADWNRIVDSNKLNAKNKFKLPSGARTTFHMAFSGDGKLVASCHGDHNVYVCEIKSGKVIRTLRGHPRTPWCVVFHPSQSDILASGCLAGHVRVWDLKGGSELLVTDSGTVIASLAFHPSVRLLAIGTFNEVIFWDWSRGDVPLARSCTDNVKEKVRLVRFDSTGRYLITGITNFPSVALGSNPNATLLHPAMQRPPSLIPIGEIGRDIQEELADRQDRFQESYRQLVTHYEDLVQHYHTFLRSRIPRIFGVDLEDRLNDTSGTASAFARSQTIPQLLQPFVPPMSVRSFLAATGIPIPDIDNEQPGPSSRLMNSNATTESPASPPSIDIPDPDVVEPQDTTGAGRPSLSNNRDASSDSVAGSSRGIGSSSSRGRNDFGSIEALAQNIIEMQHLCSQARQRVHLGGGPTSMEAHHVMELQQIRQHLEVLQDQTRRLQHSIRETLTSLASGSLAIRSQEATPTNNTAGLPGLENIATSVSSTPGPMNNVNPSLASASGAAASATNNTVLTLVPPTATEEQRPRRSISPSTSNSASFFRISVGPNTDRMRVPPVVRYSDGNRRIVMDHHSRNCPFNISQQPPPPGHRTRCLIEEEGQVELEHWPSYETGMTLRNFPGVESVRVESVTSPSTDMNLRVYVVHGGVEDVEMRESWQRSFLPGVAVVPTDVREGRRARIRIRRGPRTQVPHRLNNSFIRSFYIRAEGELIPVYSSQEQTGNQEIRDNLGSRVFIFPISVFFNDFDSSQQIGIYWPCQSPGEEHALNEARRFGTPLNVYPNQNSLGRRVRISYDTNSLDIEVGGVRLVFIQPGVRVLEAVTTLRGGGTRGAIFVDYLAPLLEGMEQYFGLQFLGHRFRRRQPRRIITFARDNGMGGPYEYSRLPEFRGGPRISHFHDGPLEEETRRVLSLAVDTVTSTASELLINRRPVESRIERVLNSSTALNSYANSTSQAQSTASASSVAGSQPERLSSNVPTSPRTDFQERLERWVQDAPRSQTQRNGRSTTSSASTQTMTAGGPASSERVSLYRRPTGVLGGVEERLIINRNIAMAGPPHQQLVIRRQRRFTNQPVQRIVDSGTSARTRASPSSNQSGREQNTTSNDNMSNNNSNANDDFAASIRYLPNNPEILITPRATLNGSGTVPPGVPFFAPFESAWSYRIDAAAASSFLSSRIQRWNFSQFIVPDISKRHLNLVVPECSLHSDACFDISQNSEFLAVLQPSNSGAYSAVGIYGLKNDNLGDLLTVFHFDQNTVSVSISPSSQFICVGYAGRGPMYRVLPQGNSTGRNIGQILSVNINEKSTSLLPVRGLFCDNSGGIMAINCMHFLPVPGMGIVYGTNTGELVLLQ